MRPINLLPPEVARERSRRRRVGGVAVAAAAYLVVLVIGVFWWNTRVGSAEDDLAVQQEANRVLEQELATLTDSGSLRDTYDEKAGLVREALTNDVDWGIVLNDLARLLPPRVWVENFSGTVLPTATPGVLGQVTFSGIGFDFPDVSAWLRALDSEQFVGITGSWVSTASQGSIGDDDVVNFSSTAVLTPGAATARVETLIPEVEEP